MNSSLILTLFLSLGGLLAFWSALKDYDWFFEFPGPSQLFILAVGRPAARKVYIVFGVFLLGWGLVRMIDPPKDVPVDFIYEMASPQGIELSNVKVATSELMGARDSIYGLETDREGWVSFWWNLDAQSPYFAYAKASSTAGPDFHEGFAFRGKEVGGKKLAGRIIYFDSELTSCDNVLFSKHPLDSASFVMIICSPDVSKENGVEGSLAVFYCREGSALYRKLVR